MTAYDVDVNDARAALVLGAGASLAAPAGRPMFAALRKRLTDRVDVQLKSSDLWARMAPEALLSRLGRAGIDIDAELRHMLAGGKPNALHFAAASVLRRGGAVWTTNFDELVEAAAAEHNVDFHRLLPGDNPACACPKGHIVKVHGTLSGSHVLARSEEVLRPLPHPWFARLTADLSDATTVVVGYAGADIDLRTGLRDALGGSRSALWFGTEWDETPLRRRFGQLLDDGVLGLRLSKCPDLECLGFLTDLGLDDLVSAEVRADAERPTELPVPPEATFQPTHELRGRILDDFGSGAEARKSYLKALRYGPRRRAAARDVMTSGLIHGGARWRKPALAVLDVACALPLRWLWPHRYRLVYLTWNAEPSRRWAAAKRALDVSGEDPFMLLQAANAAKEVDPARAVDLAFRAQRRGEEAAQARAEGEHPSAVAWATFTASLALRWVGDTRAARGQASRLSDGFDALAGPVWVGWGHFEAGAVAALEGDFGNAVSQMEVAAEVFAAAGSPFVFDALCGQLAVTRAAGRMGEWKTLHDRARSLVLDGTRTSRFAREVLLSEEAEKARAAGRLDEAWAGYRQLAESPTAAQRVLGLLGLGEVQRLRGERPAAAHEALRVSADLRFGYGEVHAAVTLGLAGDLSVRAAERRIAESAYEPPVGDGDGLLRFCLGPHPEVHALCFP
jgi:hypothetical protein